MSVAKAGDTVSIDYTGTLDDGSIFDSSVGKEPLQFTLGSGQVIPGFDKMVDGMAVGETKKDTILAADAYGEPSPNMIMVVNASEFPKDFKPEIGLGLQLQSDKGQVLPAIITKIEDSKITLDGNNPMAGKDLTFEITLVEIK